jgi:hypothetical protein
MGRHRRDRWLPAEAFSIPADARGGAGVRILPPQPVRAWVQTPDRHVRVDGRALWATPDAVLVEWGFGQAATSAWVRRAAVKHRTP